MNINDYFKTDDKIGPRGYVILKKADGTVLFEKENLVVYEGRKYIREVFINNALASDFLYNNQYNDYGLTKAAFGAAGNATSFDTTALGSIIGATKIDLQKEIIEAPYGQMYIVFKASITPTTGQVVRELGLYLADTKAIPTLDDILFSRVVFDATPVEANETYDLDYYLYF